MRQLVTTLAALAFLLCPLLVNAQRPHYTSRLLQDEVEELSMDYTAFLNSAQQVSIQLELLADQDAGLQQTLVTVVSPSGERREYEADATGLVTIPNAEPGPHAIVASGDNGHGTTVMYFKEPDPDKPARRSNRPTRMTLVNMQAPDLAPFVEKMRKYYGDRTVDCPPEDLRRYSRERDEALRNAKARTSTLSSRTRSASSKVRTQAQSSRKATTYVISRPRTQPATRSRITR